MRQVKQHKKNEISNPIVLGFGTNCTKKNLFPSRWFSLFLFSFRRYIRTFHAYSRRRIHAMVKSQTFYWIVIALVLMNTVVLASEYYGQPVELTFAQGRTHDYHDRMKRSVF